MFQFSHTGDDWKIIASDCENKWNFPHCLGALDGKHIEITPPAGSGSYFYNYKHKHSMVLLAIADANYRFILLDLAPMEGYQMVVFYKTQRFLENYRTTY